MFEEYKNEQPIAVETLINSINNNKLSHAYIFETNNYPQYHSFVTQFIKYIVCPNSREKNHNEKECNICSSINENNYIELKTINSDTLQIKKEALQELQREFKNKAIQGNKKIYLIENAEKLNDSSSNTILKFLEEPEDNIIAIILVPSRYMLLDTIISRCQIIQLIEKYDQSSLNNKIKTNYYLNYQDKDKIDELVNIDINNIVNIIDFIEKNKKDAILFTKNIIFDKYNNREDIVKMLEIMKIFYYDVLKYKTSSTIRNFINYKNDIIKIDSSNNINSIIDKLNIINEIIVRTKYNVNINLLIDKLIIDLDGVKDVGSC